MIDGSEMIRLERKRQKEVEGYENDDWYVEGELALAAESYLLVYNGDWPDFGKPPGIWPWKERFWKPSKDNQINLLKAGALIAAELDRCLNL